VALASAAIVGGARIGFGGAVAYLLPPLLLLAALAMRRYPGDRALLALMVRARRSPRQSRRASRLARSRRRVVLPRGGGLIAFSLAMRPPPALSGSLS